MASTYKFCFLLCFLTFLSFGSNSAIANENTGYEDYLVDELRKSQELISKRQFKAAISSIENVVQFYSETGNISEKCKALVLLATAYREIGDQKSTVKKLKEAEKLAIANGLEDLLPGIKNSLGSTLTFSRNGDDAELYLNNSLNLAKELDNYPLIPVILNNLGNYYSAKKEYSSAQNHYKECVELARKTKQNTLAAQALSNAAFSAAKEKRISDAINFQTQAIKELSVVDEGEQKTKLLLKIGQTYCFVMEQFPDTQKELLRNAHSVLEQAITMSKELESPQLTTNALGYLGQIYGFDERYDEAFNLTHQAIFLSSKHDIPEALYRWYWNAARWHESLKNYDNAITYYDLGINTLQNIRHDVTVVYGNFTSSFREEFGELYFKYAGLLFDRAQKKKADGEKYQSDLRKLQEVIELLKTAEIEDYFHDECANIRLKQREKISDVVKNIDEKTAVIYYAVLPFRTVILSQFSDQAFESTEVPIQRPQLAKIIEDFRENISKVNCSTCDYLTPSQKLYDLLIKPVNSSLISRKIKNLAIIPDDVLFTVPFGAMNDGTNYLIQKFAIAITPGLSLTDPKSGQRTFNEIMLNGLSEAVQGHLPLKFSQEEITKVGAVFEETKDEPLMDKKFIKKNVERLLHEKQFPIVHMATHGEFSSDVANSYILTYDGRYDLKQLEGLIRPSQFRGEPIELLTLSACATARGDFRAALGLAGISFQAGARSTLASLWNVDDPSTSKFMELFYKNLRNKSSEKKISKSEALQLASIDLMKKGFRYDEKGKLIEFDHPYYWSPFIIIGNWL